VLSRAWPRDRQWTFADEDRTNKETMARFGFGSAAPLPRKNFILASAI